jgi:hypothetical protein
MRLRTANCWVTVVLCSALSPCVNQAASGDSPGLSVRDGVLTRAGRPYRGIGVNDFDLFYRRLLTPSDATYADGLRQLSEAGIPFVRFSCGGFWPIDWDLYLTNKGKYFALLDDVVRSAEREHVGLIPSLFWYTATVPDIVGEPIDQLGNRESKTIAFIRRYTEELVTRYADSPAIWGWEFGNEFNLVVDLPNAAQHRPHVVPRLKTAATRTARDEMRCEHMLTGVDEFAKTVRKHDRCRMIITGNSIPRPSAYHNSLERSWKPDTAEQFNQILLRDNPDPFDMLCVHIYPDKASKYPAFAADLRGLVRTVQDMSVHARKPLFIGEFGSPSDLGPEKERTAFEELLGAIEASGVPLAALWVFDYSPQGKDWNVTFSNRRAYMLDLLAKANRRMRLVDSQPAEKALTRPK